MDSVIIAVVTVLLIVVGALFLNWEIHRQERKGNAPEAKGVQANASAAAETAA